MDYVKQIEQYKQENEKLKAERDFLSKENQKMKFHIIPSKSGAISGLRMKVNDLTYWLDMLKENLAMVKADLETVTRERDAAVEQLRGTCSACDNYTPNHNEGPCRSCCYEIARDPKVEVNDNWRWNGGRK